MSEQAPAVSPGHLYVVATPIGHLGDLSPRAAAVLGSVDRILAEDTRTSGVLLQQLGIQRPISALHEHNERAQTEQLIARLAGGETLALISDAGTPLISDPGFVLVRAARAADLPVVAVPGPCALVAALSIAGLPTDRFTFIGFLPAKSGARRQAVASLRAVPHTLVAYEASHRIVDTAGDLAAVLGPDRPVMLARELTKRFEQSVACPAGDLAGWLQADPNRQRGEFVLVIAGAPVAASDDVEAAAVLKVLLAELPASRAARVAAELTGLPRKRLYEMALMAGGGDDR